jgi:hypothetical protein
MVGEVKHKLKRRIQHAIRTLKKFLNKLCVISFKIRKELQVDVFECSQLKLSPLRNRMAL